jgi:hypothetical protein
MGCTNGRSAFGSVCRSKNRHASCTADGTRRLIGQDQASHPGRKTDNARRMSPAGVFVWERIENSSL